MSLYAFGYEILGLEIKLIHCFLIQNGYKIRINAINPASKQLK